jgi:hypothetical protein
MRKLLLSSALVSMVTLLFGQDFASLGTSYNASTKSGKLFSSANTSATKINKIQSFSYEVDDLPICTVAPKEEGVIYRIQITTANSYDKNSIPGINLQGLGPVYREYLLNQPSTRYLLGDFSFESDALYSLEKVWSAGFDHAFIVKYVDGFRVSF